MNKIKKSSELLWILGFIFVAFGVAICSKANLGVSMIAAPAFIVSEAMLRFSEIFSVGVTEYIIQGIILVLMCIVVRRFNWRYLLAFAVAVLYGYTLNLFLWILGDVTFDAIWLRWIMLIVGDLIIAFGIACFFRTYLPLQVYELFVAETADRFHIGIGKVKTAFDVTLLVISVVLAITLFGDVTSFDWSGITHTSYHSIGLGTFVTTAVNSPFIAIMGKLVDRIFEPSPRFKKLESFLKLG
ncbi:MAG: hypothetical protein IJY93_09700 [Clostridia bacterium]|nr:hypothetical protein [Clostridia bacterium]